MKKNCSLGASKTRWEKLPMAGTKRERTGHDRYFTQKKRERKRISIALILYQFGETRYLARPAKFNLHLKLLRWQIRDNFHIIRDTCREMDVQKKKESASVHSWIWTSLNTPQCAIPGYPPQQARPSQLATDTLAISIWGRPWACETRGEWNRKYA